MMNCMALLLFGHFVALVSGKSYEGYKVIHTQVLKQEQALALKKVEDNYDFWKPIASGFSTDVLVPPSLMKQMKQILKDFNIDHSIVIEDVEKLIKVQNQKSRTHRGYNGKINFKEYYSHDDLNAYIGDVAAKYPFATATLIGKSIERRPMIVLSLLKAGRGKPNIWIEAGIHAREWIAPAMAIYIIDQLLNNDKDGFLSKLNFHILPCANPDGYEFSRMPKEDGGDRLWRKNRAVHGGLDPKCIGVDLNRNWAFHFGEEGSSNDKCSLIYRGPSACSEIECRNIRDYVLGLKPVPVLATSLHSYGQYYMRPYGYSQNAVAENDSELKGLASEAILALQKVFGTKFVSLKASQIGITSGTSIDWYKASKAEGGLGARFVYTIELRDHGIHKFFLPEEQIEPSGKELWQAQRVVFKKMIEVSNIGRGDVEGHHEGEGIDINGVERQDGAGVIGNSTHLLNAIKSRVINRLFEALIEERNKEKKKNITKSL